MVIIETIEGLRKLKIVVFILKNDLFMFIQQLCSRTSQFFKAGWNKSGRVCKVFNFDKGGGRRLFRT